MNPEDQYHEDQEAAGEYLLAAYDGSVEAIIVWGPSDCNDVREDETK